MNWDQAKWLLEKYLYETQARYEALPAPHAITHKGGDDDLTGTQDPSPIVPGDEGSIGDGTGGFAPIDHVHDATALEDVTGLAELITDVGFQVQDVRLNLLLEKIHLNLVAQNELLAAIKDRLSGIM
jgi:hypothetical protein